MNPKTRMATTEPLLRMVLLADGRSNLFEQGRDSEEFRNDSVANSVGGSGASRSALRRQ